MDYIYSELASQLASAINYAGKNSYTAAVTIDDRTKTVAVDVKPTKDPDPAATYHKRENQVNYILLISRSDDGSMTQSWIEVDSLYKKVSQLQYELVDNVTKVISNLAVKGNTTLEGDLIVAGQTRFAGGLAIESLDMDNITAQTLEVSKTARFDQDITVEGSPLKALINSEAARATREETSLKSSIAQEATTARGAEQALADKVAGVQSDIQGVETTLKAGINKETEDRIAADNSLVENLTSESNRAKQQEGSLSKRLDALDTLVSIQSGDLGVLKSFTETLSESVASMESSLGAATKSLSELQTAVSESATKIQSVEGSVADKLDKTTAASFLTGGSQTVVGSGDEAENVFTFTRYGEEPSEFKFVVKNGSQGAAGPIGPGIKWQATADSCVEVGDSYIDSESGHIKTLSSKDPREFTDGGRIVGPPGTDASVTSTSVAGVIEDSSEIVKDSSSGLSLKLAPALKSKYEGYQTSINNLGSKLDNIFTKSETLDNISKATIGLGGTVSSNVGGYKQGDQIDPTDTLRSILIKLLLGEIEVPSPTNTPMYISIGNPAVETEVDSSKAFDSKTSQYKGKEIGKLAVNGGTPIDCIGYGPVELSETGLKLKVNKSMKVVGIMAYDELNATWQPLGAGKSSFGDLSTREEDSTYATYTLTELGKAAAHSLISEPSDCLIIIESI